MYFSFISARCLYN